MGRNLDKFKSKAKNFGGKVEGYVEKKINQERPHSNKINRIDRDTMGDHIGIDEEDEVFDEDMSEENYDETFRDDLYNDNYKVEDAQRPESFHHFILENQYKDIERSIRGLKDVWDKDKQEWTTKRKAVHCFTDEESEEILRTAQSHLATDIKLGFIKVDSYGDFMMTIYEEISFLFESIAEYRYGRYKNFEEQYQMKLQNMKIFLELFSRIQMNYSRAIGGQENKATHNSVRGQESLQSGDRDYTGQNKRYD